MKPTLINWASPLTPRFGMNNRSDISSQMLHVRMHWGVFEALHIWRSPRAFLSLKEDLAFETTEEKTVTCTHSAEHSSLLGKVCGIKQWAFRTSESPSHKDGFILSRLTVLSTWWLLTLKLSMTVELEFLPTSLSSEISTSTDAFRAIARKVRILLIDISIKERGGKEEQCERDSGLYTNNSYCLH